MGEILIDYGPLEEAGFREPRRVESEVAERETEYRLSFLRFIKDAITKRFTEGDVPIIQMGVVGSVSRGTAREESDMDLDIVVDKGNFHHAKRLALACELEFIEELPFHVNLWVSTYPGESLKLLLEGLNMDKERREQLGDDRFLRDGDLFG